MNWLIPKNSSVGWKEGNTLLDTFEICNKLGQGGMGEVWRVRNAVLQEDYAVKRARLSTPVERRNFMAELITWIGLPDHPNIVNCRFFRTAAEELLIFSELVKGFSLSKLIESRAYGTEEVIDIAIQIAQGLEAAHHQGVVHQDMKPDNVLISAKGEVKVTDFGLARARIAAEPQFTLGNESYRKVTYLGGTFAYFSPEQGRCHAERLAKVSKDRQTKLTSLTDIWSWGASILELLIGYRPWNRGELAASTFEDYLRGEQDDCYIKQIPSELASVIGKALTTNTEDRWQSLAEPMEALLAISKLPTRYAHIAPRTMTPEQDSSLDRHSQRYGLWWQSSEDVISQTLRILGKDPATASDFLINVSASGKTWFLANLFAYEEAIRLMAPAATSGTEALAESLADLYQGKAFLHLTLNDQEGAFTAFNVTTAIYEQLVQQGRSDLLKRLADCYANKASFFQDESGAEAIELVDRAIAKYEALAPIHDPQTLKDLAIAYSNKAAILFKGHSEASNESIPWFKKAIEMIESLLANNRTIQLEIELARCYSNLGLIITVFGDDANSSIEYQDKAIQIYERLVLKEQQNQLADRLAESYFKRAVNLSLDSKEYSELMDKAIAILEPLIENQRRTDLAVVLAICYEKKGSLLASREDKQGVDVLTKGIKRLEDLAYKEGLLHVVPHLVSLYHKMAAAVALTFRDAGKSLEFNDKAIKLLERVLKRERNDGMARTLAACYKEKAVDLGVMRHHAASFEEYGRAANLFRQIFKDDNETLEELLDCRRTQVTLAEKQGDLDLAQSVIAEAINFYESRVHAVNLKIRKELVNCYRDQATLALKQDDLHLARHANFQAISISGSLIAESEDSNLKLELAESYLQGAMLLDLTAGPDRAEVTSAYERAIQLFEQLIAAGRKDVLPRLSFCREKKQLSAKLQLVAQPGNANIESEIAALEHDVHVRGKIVRAIELAELYLNRLTALIASGTSTSGIREGISTAVRQCNELADTAILEGRNDIFEKLSDTQARIKRLAESLRID
jgi:serine/threonine protein kinase